MKTLSIIAGFCLVLLFAGIMLGNSSEEQAAITAVQTAYQSTPRLDVLHPDLEGSQWSAFALGDGMCSARNCYEVVFLAYGIDDGNDVAIEAKWYVSVEDHKFEPIDRGARIYFSRKP